MVSFGIDGRCGHSGCGTVAEHRQGGAGGLDGLAQAGAAAWGGEGEFAGGREEAGNVGVAIDAAWAALLLPESLDGERNLGGAEQEDLAGVDAEQVEVGLHGLELGNRRQEELDFEAEELDGARA